MNQMMKIIYWNLFEGCREDWRLKKVLSFVKKEKPDVLCLSELNGWQDQNFTKLELFKKKAGLKYSLFAKASSGYNLGIFSKLPFLKSDIITKGFNTGLILASLPFQNSEINIALTHLHHINEAARLKEVKILLSKISLKKNTVLLGDMNSLSPNDPYPEKPMLKRLKEMGLKKFGQTKLQKKVISRFQKFGLIDAVSLFSKNFEYSVPTGYDKDPKHFTRLRLDYAFITPPLSGRTVGAKIIRDKITQNASDHFPVGIKLK